METETECQRSRGKRDEIGGDEERERVKQAGSRKERHSQDLQIAQCSEGSIFDAADVVAVQLPAEQRNKSAAAAGPLDRETERGREEEGRGRGGERERDAFPVAQEKKERKRKRLND